jgi:hypothetical protein
MSPATKVVRVFGFTAMPSAALLLASPVGLAIWAAPRLTLGAALLVAPFYVGLERPRIRVRGVHGGRAAQLPARRRWWVRTSLGGALASSLGGVWGGLLAPTLLIPSIASAIAVRILWRDFERAQRDSRPFGKKSAHSEQAGHPSS